MHGTTATPDARGRRAARALSGYPECPSTHTCRTLPRGGSMAVVVHRHHPAGVAEAVPLVLLPAFPFGSRMWQEVVAALPGIPPLTVDLPGFGAAHEWAAPEGTMLESYADALADALDGAEVRKAVVAGVSMGGYVLPALAERYPGLLAGVGLLDTKASADTSDATANRLAIARRALGKEGAGAVIEIGR